MSWSCGACTFINHVSQQACVICETKRPKDQRGRTSTQRLEGQWIVNSETPNCTQQAQTQVSQSQSTTSSPSLISSNPQRSSSHPNPLALTALESFDRCTIEEILTHTQAMANRDRQKTLNNGKQFGREYHILRKCGYTSVESFDMLCDGEQPVPLHQRYSNPTTTPHPTPSSPNHSPLSSKPSTQPQAHPDVSEREREIELERKKKVVSDSLGHRNNEHTNDSEGTSWAVIVAGDEANQYDLFNLEVVFEMCVKKLGREKVILIANVDEIYQRRKNAGIALL